MPLTNIDEALSSIGKGSIAIVINDEDCENEGDLIMAAEMATPETISYGKIVHRGSAARTGSAGDQAKQKKPDLLADQTG